MAKTLSIDQCRYEWFIQNASMEAGQCLILEHSMSGPGNSGGKKGTTKSRLPPSIRTVATTLDSPNVFRSEFDKLVATVQDITNKHQRGRK